MIKAFIDLALASIGGKSSLVPGQRPLALWRAVGAALDMYKLYIEGCLIILQFADLATGPPK